MRHDIIVIGASMGGFQALKQIISEFPKDLKAAVFVVLHIPSDHESFLAKSFGLNANVPVLSAKEGDTIKLGHVYVAIPDFHLRIDETKIKLDHGPKHNFSRPAVDPLFTSAALHYGPRVIGVILTGALDDGTNGLMDIKRYGGRSVIQTPSDAVNASMPMNALTCVPIDHSVLLSEMGRLLTGLAGSLVDPSFIQKAQHMPKPSKPELSTHICPECNGPMWVIETGKLLHYHCRIGHAFSGQSLLLEKTQAIESALWSAVNALKDKANISRKLSERKKDKDYYSNQAINCDSYAEIITDIILKEGSPTASSSIEKPDHKKSA